jgi:hypothetical protein
MGDAPTTTNSAAQAVDSALKSIINDVVISAAKAAAVAALPWLSWPVISQLFDALLNWIGGYVYTAMAEWSTIGVIDIQTWMENSDYQKALSDLKAARDQAVKDLQTAGQAGDQNAINTAKQNFKNTFQNLVHWDGSATPK